MKVVPGDAGAVAVVGEPCDVEALVSWCGI